MYMQHTCRQQAKKGDISEVIIRSKPRSSTIPVGRSGGILQHFMSVGQGTKHGHCFSWFHQHAVIVFTSVWSTHVGIEKMKRLTLPKPSTFAHSHFPQKIPPKSPKRGSQTEFPGIPRAGLFCGNSTEPLQFPGISRNFPAHPGFRNLGSPFSAFLGGNDIDTLGNTES